MKFRTDYLSASGSYHEGYCFLAHRYDPAIGFRRREVESIVVRARPAIDPKTKEKYSTLQIVFKTSGRLVELWRSPTDHVFVADSFGTMLHSHMPEGKERTPWEETELSSLHGVWGLDDERVFAFGRDGGKSTVFQWNGRKWSPIKAPSFQVEAMHGLSPDSIWACGEGGRVGRLAGKGWEEFKLPYDGTILSIFVAAPGEYYACSDMGTIFEGSDTGWQAIGAIPDALQGDVQAVAKYAGKLWVGASRLGLWRRKGKTNKYECVKPNIPANNFDTRHDLLIGSETAICFTDDGKSFVGEGDDYVSDQRKNAPLGKF